ncbi:hypothetical protein P168DRAFT_44254 [Aspergillus campestris IBT 28561]|uniref:Secreted protein n=1 Tax=Aspergillus campestris (strain IBT 28561) TaxID=1392248 RepID=A0A2I1CXD5_ASPC2|nr:uncharacterized protein P168DRAFT_44254 [Aspergillus campestris IBT 28561]PKY02280.1 hypothetical protein P168DRAFT_44254 [Aspergillus campestris IBT 28561]
MVSRNPSTLPLSTVLLLVTCLGYYDEHPFYSIVFSPVLIKGEVGCVIHSLSFFCSVHSTKVCTSFVIMLYGDHPSFCSVFMFAPSCHEASLLPPGKPPNKINLSFITEVLRPTDTDKTYKHDLS